jgi:hypothetical protein
MSSLNKEISKGTTRLYREAYIKRRSTTTGLFESDWQEITNDIKKWGRITTSVDAEQYAKIKFPSVKLKVANDEGRYNPDDDENSLWNGYAPQQRSLVKIVGGYVKQEKGSDGVWTNTRFPGNALWDVARFDNASFDGEDTIFKGIIVGDINLSDKNETIITVKPLTEVFRHFPAKNLNFFTSTGMTASEFMEGLRDMTDGSGVYVFRPFFEDTTTNWDINTTTTNYAYLDSAGAKNVRDKTVWDVIERLSQAENYVPYITNDGKFVFSDRSTSSGAGFDFDFDGSGLGSVDSGKTIKTITRFGKRFSKFYDRVEVKHLEEDTSTSLEVVEASFQVTGGNLPWYYGSRTFSIENTWITDSATANALATSIFNNTSNVKDEIEFTTSFIPHLNILESCTITYDSSGVVPDSLWDNAEWADTIGAAETGDELIWDASGGDAIKLSGDEFRLLSVSIDLDKLECRFHARGA